MMHWDGHDYYLLVNGEIGKRSCVQSINCVMNDRDGDDETLEMWFMS